MKSKPCPVIKTDWFTIYPSLTTDTYKGKPITAGRIFMRIHAGTVTVQGKEIEIGAAGAQIVLSYNGRSCALNAEHFIREAVKAGLTKKSLNFKELTP